MHTITNLNQTETVLMESIITKLLFELEIDFRGTIFQKIKSFTWNWSKIQFFWFLCYFSNEHSIQFVSKRNCLYPIFGTLVQLSTISTIHRCNWNTPTVYINWSYTFLSFIQTNSFHLHIIFGNNVNNNWREQKIHHHTFTDNTPICWFFYYCFDASSNDFFA